MTKQTTIVVTSALRVKTLIVLALANVILCFILSKLVHCVSYAHMPFKLDSFPIFLIVRLGISVSFWSRFGKSSYPYKQQYAVV